MDLIGGCLFTRGRIAEGPPPHQKSKRCGGEAGKGKEKKGESGEGGNVQTGSQALVHHMVGENEGWNDGCWFIVVTMMFLLLLRSVLRFHLLCPYAPAQHHRTSKDCFMTANKLSGGSGCAS